jgi:hypothetical protein
VRRERDPDSCVETEKQTKKLLQGRPRSASLANILIEFLHIYLSMFRSSDDVAVSMVAALCSKLCLPKKKDIT